MKDITKELALDYIEGDLQMTNDCLDQTVAILRERMAALELLNGDEDDENTPGDYITMLTSLLIRDGSLSRLIADTSSRPPNELILFAAICDHGRTPFDLDCGPDSEGEGRILWPEYMGISDAGHLKAAYDNLIRWSLIVPGDPWIGYNAPETVVDSWAEAGAWIDRPQRQEETT